MDSKNVKGGMIIQSRAYEMYQFQFLSSCIGFLLLRWGFSAIELVISIQICTFYCMTHQLHYQTNETIFVDVNLAQANYIFIFRFCEARAFCYLNRPFLKVVSLILFKKNLLFCLRLTILLRTTLGFHSISNCFKPMQSHLKPRKFSQGTLPPNIPCWEDPRCPNSFLCLHREHTTCLRQQFSQKRKKSLFRPL